MTIKQSQRENTMKTNLSFVTKLYIILINKYHVINKFTNRHKKSTNSPTSLKSMKSILVFSSGPKSK